MALMYGDELYNDIRDCIQAILESLKSEMKASNILPRIEAIYDTPEQGIMSFPAVTISLQGITNIDEAVDSFNDAIIYSACSCSIRCHVDYEGGRKDEEKTLLLLGSIQNYIRENARARLKSALGSRFISMNFRDESIQLGLNFADSLTIGGEYKFSLITQLTYAR